jgi:hypothetical protein
MIGHQRSYSSVLLQGVDTVLSDVGVVAAMEVALVRRGKSRVKQMEQTGPTMAYMTAVQVSDKYYEDPQGQHNVETDRLSDTSYAIRNVALAAATCAAGRHGEETKNTLYSDPTRMHSFLPPFEDATWPSALTRIDAIRTALSLVGPLMATGSTIDLSCGFKYFFDQTYDERNFSKSTTEDEAAEQLAKQARGFAEALTLLNATHVISLRRGGVLDAFVSKAFAQERGDYSLTDIAGTKIRFELHSERFVRDWAQVLDEWFAAAHHAVDAHHTLDLLAERVLQDPPGALLTVGRFMATSEHSEAEWERVRNASQAFVNDHFVEGDPSLQRQRTMDLVRLHVTNWDEFVSEVQRLGGESYLEEWEE